MVCKVCGTENNANSKVCIFCGNTLNSVIVPKAAPVAAKINNTSNLVCSVCGTTNKGTDTVCNFCGTDLVKPTFSSQKNTPQIVSIPKRNATNRSNDNICPACLHANKSSSSFCELCGKKIKAVSQIPISHSKNSIAPVVINHPIHRRSPRLNIIVIIIIILLILTGTFLGLLSAYDQFQPDHIIAEQDDQNTYIKFSENNIWINEGFTDIPITDSDLALDVIGSMKNVIGISDARAELTYAGENKIGKTTYYRYDQQYKEIPVSGHSIIIAADNFGNAHLLNSNYVPMNNLSAEPEISKDEASDAATKYIKQNYPDMKITEIAVGDMVFSKKSSTEVALSYRMQAHLKDSENYMSIREIYISAISGDVLSDNDAFTYASIKGYYEGQLSYKNIIVDYKKPTYTMVDAGRDIKGMNLVKNTFNLEAVQSWTVNEEVPDKSTVDAMANIEYVYDYFNNTFNYKPGGNKGKRTILFYTDVGLVQTEPWQIVWNAAYTPDENSLYDIFMFGGKVFKGYCLSRDIDVVAHEYTHSVVDSTAVFNKEPQPKAINEAYADIFGILIEAAYNNNDPDWIINSINHNIASPKKPYITTWSEYSDKLNCHAASTLISHVAYLMNIGMDSSNGSYKASQSAINKTIMAEIWYSALSTMHSDDTFIECRKAVEDAANQIYREGRIKKMQLDCVTQAFDLAGIEKPSSLINITNPKPEQTTSETGEGTLPKMLTGYYFYKNEQTPHLFTMEISQNGIHINGAISEEWIDDNQVVTQHPSQFSGSFDGSEMTFSKVYDTDDSYIINYTGSLSEDHQWINGFWQINDLSPDPDGTFIIDLTGSGNIPTPIIMPSETTDSGSFNNVFTEQIVNRLFDMNHQQIEEFMGSNLRITLSDEQSYVNTIFDFSLASHGFLRNYDYNGMCYLVYNELTDESKPTFIMFDNDAIIDFWGIGIDSPLSELDNLDNQQISKPYKFYGNLSKTIVSNGMKYRFIGDPIFCILVHRTNNRASSDIDNTSIQFSSTEFEQVIKKKLGINERNVTVDDIKYITEHNLNFEAIRDISDIVYFKNLEYLSLCQAYISDFSPLTALTRL